MIMWPAGQKRFGSHVKIQKMRNKTQSQKKKKQRKSIATFRYY